jgi:hypothetical protein
LPELQWRVGSPAETPGEAVRRPLMKKSELPVKTCLTCGLPFTWRKKWARCWDEVRYCSERCRRNKA